MIFRNKKERLLESWIVKLDRGLSEKEELEFKELSKSDPELVEAIERTIKPWDVMIENAGEIDQMLIKEAESEDNFFSFDSWQLRITLVSVCCLLLAFTAFVVFKSHWEHPDSMLIVYDNEEPLTKRFDDGSVVRINRGTKIDYRFTDKVRLVNIIDGEAFFEVAKNPDLPFIVYNKRIKVKAVGTAFNVKITGFDFGVIVTEGSVEIKANQEAYENHDNIDTVANGLYDSGEILDVLTVGEKTVVRTDNETIIAKEEIPLTEEELLWKKDLLTFNGSTLKELSVEFERKTGIKLIINNPKLQNLEVVGGFFSTNDPYVILNLLERNYGIRWEHIDDRIIKIYSLD